MKRLKFSPVIPRDTPPSGFQIIGRWLSNRVNLAQIARRFGANARVCVGNPWPLVLSQKKVWDVDAPQIANPTNPLTAMNPTLATPTVNRGPTIRSPNAIIHQLQAEGKHGAAEYYKEIAWALRTLSPTELVLLCRMNDKDNGLPNTMLTTRERWHVNSLARRGLCYDCAGSPQRKTFKSNVGAFVYF